eukprot:scaffold55573_cov30-Tisochrysis_lutea.AAC.4
MARCGHVYQSDHRQNKPGWQWRLQTERCVAPLSKGNGRPHTAAERCRAVWVAQAVALGGLSSSSPSLPWPPQPRQWPQWLVSRPARRPARALLPGELGVVLLVFEDASLKLGAVSCYKLCCLVYDLCGARVVRVRPTSHAVDAAAAT